MLIYKLLRADEWAALAAEGETQGAPIDVQDGYIHFSTADQVRETAEKYFAGVDGVMLLAYDSERLGDDLRWEASRGGALFPHLYGLLRLADGLWAEPLPLHNGRHIFPDPIQGHVDPTRTAFEVFKAHDRDTPIDMLNLVRLRTVAAYPDGHPSAGSSGKEAYAAYGRESQAVLATVGGTLLWRGAFQSTLIGPAHEHWD
ncbi:MAG: DUF952 domain-containing protein, partial [Pseudomonadota bacterium]